MPAAIPPEPVCRLAVSQYHEMIAAGILTEDDPRRIYARAGIPLYWVVNLVDRRIEVYSDPTGPAKRPDYRRQTDYAALDDVAVLIEGHQLGRISVAAVLPASV
jgi:hypothetical protein